MGNTPSVNFEIERGILAFPASWHATPKIWQVGVVVIILAIRAWNYIHRSTYYFEISWLAHPIFCEWNWIPFYPRLHSHHNTTRIFLNLIVVALYCRWVGFVYCWQFIELGFIIRFHIRNRRQNYSRYGYEEFLTSRHEEMSIGPPPPATALIVAYLPNEAGIIMQTLMHFKQYKYQGNLQVCTENHRGQYSNLIFLSPVGH